MKVTMCRFIRKCFRFKFIVLFIIIIFLMIGYVLILNEDFSVYDTLNVADNTSCYKSVKNDHLPAAEDLNPSARSIYFIETSCKGDLNPRQACSVESVARLHPNRTVYILFLASIAQKTLDKGPINNLKKFSNVEFVRIHFWKFVEGTVLEGLVYDGYLNKSKWPISHTSDVLRYLVLYKWGGTYLDLDVIARKSLDSLGLNWASRENREAVASCVLSFSTDAVGRSIANATVHELARNFRGDLWAHNGPGVITRVLQQRCNVSTAKMSAEYCDGFEVYGPKLLLPVRWQDWKVYFEPGELNSPETILHHIWNRKSSYQTVSADSPYAKLAREFCPTTYNAYKDVF